MDKLMTYARKSRKKKENYSTPKYDAYASASVYTICALKLR